LIVGFQIMVFGLVADMIKNQRRVQDEILYRVKKNEVDVVHQKAENKKNDHKR